GAFEEAQRLPAGRELAEYFGVTAPTVIMAYQQLAEAGYLVSVRSQHTSVASEDQWPTDWQPPIAVKISVEEFVTELTGSSDPDSLMEQATAGGRRVSFGGALLTALHRALLAGAFEEAQRLPAAWELAEYFGESTKTVALVYRQLAEAGYVSVVPGRETSVTSREQWPSNPGPLTITVVPPVRSEAAEPPATPKLSAEDLVIKLSGTSDAGLLARQARESNWYAALVTGLHQALLSKNIEEGRRLPPSRELAEYLAISRYFVARAYQELAEAGYLNTGPGRGAAVADRKQWPKSWSPQAALDLSPEEFVGKITGSSDPELLARQAEVGSWRTALIFALHRAIVAGEFDKGQRLPSARSLAEYFGISPSPVISVYHELVVAGFLIAGMGRSTTVASDEQWPEDWSPSSAYELSPSAYELSPEKFVRKLTGSAATDLLAHQASRSSWHTALVSALHRAIVAGEFERGQRLPSTQGLAEYLDISVRTINRAYRELADAGYLIAGRGRDSVVAGREQWPVEHGIPAGAIEVPVDVAAGSAETGAAEPGPVVRDTDRIGSNPTERPVTDAEVETPPGNGAAPTAAEPRVPVRPTPWSGAAQRIPDDRDPRGGSTRRPPPEIPTAQ
ncbi:GntR family transcriptional regulator, partial [Nocardia testacea]|uniref:GntR family transcriptional regulator n=1 Tax=Nocardia testacea TaxID=248551 RepID=UPI0012F6413B